MTPSELDQLADYAEGLLDGTPDGEAVAARIATDEEWADAYRQLSALRPELSAELAALPPVTMPADVAARLESALAAEPRDAGEPALADLARLRAELARRNKAAHRWRVAGGWVAAAAVVGVCGLGVSQLASNSSGDNSDSSTVASSENKDSAPEAMSAPADARSSGTAYTTGELGPQARALLGARQPEPTPARDQSAVPSALQRLLGPADLRNCLTALGIASTPLAIDYATLDGTPAIVVVSDGGNGRITVVAAGPECGVSGAADERARTSYAR